MDGRGRHLSLGRVRRRLRRPAPARSLHELLLEARDGVPPAAIEAAHAASRDPRDLEVIVTCFNHARYLEGAAASIARQGYAGRFAVTFVDDASTDGTPELADRLAAELARDPRATTVRVLRNEANAGQWAAINRAVASSSADLLVILNDDDELAPDCLQRTVDTYERHPDLFLLGGWSVVFADGDPVHRLWQGGPISPVGPHNPLPYDALVGEPPLSRYGPEDAERFTGANDINMEHSSMSFMRAAWEAVGGYRPPETRVEWGDDRDFQMRVCSVLPIGIYERYPLAYWRWGSSVSRSLAPGGLHLREA